MKIVTSCDFAGFNAENCSCRLTKVTNSFNYFDPPHLCLSKYVEQLAAQDNNSSKTSFFQ